MILKVNTEKTNIINTCKDVYVIVKKTVHINSIFTYELLGIFQFLPLF